MMGGNQMKLEDMVVTKFDTANGYLVENLPYVLESTETKERLIAVLKHNECDALTFYTWKGKYRSRIWYRAVPPGTGPRKSYGQTAAPK